METKPLVVAPNLPPAYTFIKAYTVDRGGVRATSQLTYAKVTEIVILSGTKYHKADCSPDERPWFLINCSNSHAANFAILTDGEVFWPADMERRIITKAAKHRRSVDFTAFSMLDKDLIAEAIRQYVN
jgi:hypothetical protein